MIGYDLPGFGDELCGLPYLPRLIAKARAKLVGSMGDDIIYCCENDRRFFRDHGDFIPPTSCGWSGQPETATRRCTITYASAP